MQHENEEEEGRENPDVKEGVLRGKEASNTLFSEMTDVFLRL